MNIDYSLIHSAQTFYELLGYKYINTPWEVPNDVHKITWKHQITTNMVASGEQSFLHLILNKNLKPGKYQTITPCCREEEEDETHFKYFMKLELIDFSWTKQYNALCIANDANLFLEGEIINTTEGFDIERAGIEIGSYGARKYGKLNWVYGTGIAEPRYSISLKKERSK